MKKLGPYLCLVLVAFGFNAIGFYESVYGVGTVYHVAKTGSDSNTCVQAQSQATPKLTLASGKGCLTQGNGDTLSVHVGTYVEALIDVIPAGVIGLPTTVTNFNSEVVTLQPASGQFVFYTTNKSYITLHGLILDGVNVSVDGIKIDVGSHNFTLEGPGCEVKNAIHNVGINIQGLSNNGTIRYCDSHDNSLAAPSPDFGHGLYLQKGTGWLIEHSKFHGNGAYGVQLYPDNQGTIFQFNMVYDNGVISTPVSNMVAANQGHVIQYNWFWNNVITDNQYGLRIQFGNLAPANTTVRENTFYCAGTVAPVYIASNASNIKVQNNLIIGCNPTNAIENHGTGTTLAGNITTGTASSLFTNVATFDLNLKAGSAAIDAGTDLGLAKNGSASDVGANELPVFTSCAVENATPSKLSIQFTNNLNPPLLPASGITGFTSRKAGANNVITSAIITGSNQVDLALTNAIVGGNAVDFSYSGSGNLTDSTFIGGTANQPFNTVITNQSCTNNVGGGAASTWDQAAAFQFFGLRGSETGHVKTPYSTTPESTNVQVRVGGSVRLRVAIKCGGADCPATGFYAYYSCPACASAGTYTVVPDAFVTNEDIGYCGSSPDPDIPTSGTVTTNQLSTTGTFVPGAIVRTSNAVPLVTLTNGFKTELEYCLSFSPVATASRVYSIQLRKQDGSALNTYGSTPVITLISPAAGIGF